MLPDRNKYVNMQRHFLRSYMDLVIHTCHKRGAHATGGMAATILESKYVEQAVLKVVVQGFEKDVFSVMCVCWGVRTEVGKYEKVSV